MIDYLDKNLASEGESLGEANIYPDKYIQEPDDEEEHIVKPFEAIQTDEDQALQKEEIISAVSSGKNEAKLAIVDM